MDWLFSTVEWLNANSGVLGGAAALVSAVGASIAASTAVVSIKRSQRRERSNLDFYVRTGDLSTTGKQEPEVFVVAYNRGPATPLLATYDFDRHHGDAIRTPLAPGATVNVTHAPVEESREWRRIRFSWLDPDGSKRSAHFWYRVTGNWDANENNRKYVRVSRDERAVYFGGGPYYLHRRISPLAYIKWQMRQAHSRREILERERQQGHED